jgi:DNA-binding winged helix-turn-helix (wHTH) protein/tetratricopeptide (TPR) repeat protein
MQLKADSPNRTGGVFRDWKLLYSPGWAVVNFEPPMVPRSHGRYSFSVFCFDSKTGDLSRDNHRLRIPEQARQVLTELLEKAGSVVTREELRQRLWPGGENVDWDRAITKVIVQLRDTLRDDARESRFIETVSKRGYRFIAPVRFEPESGAPELESAQQEQTPLPAQIDAEALPLAAGSQQEPHAVSLTSHSIPERRTYLRRNFATAAALIALAGALTAWIVLHIAKPLSADNLGWQQSDEIKVGIPPFEASGDNSDRIAESFRLDLATAMAELPRVQVRATHSLNVPLRDDQSIRNAAKLLQLDVLFLGKLTLSGDHLVFELEGVRGDNLAHLGAFRYTGTIQEWGTIRERIQRDVFDRGTALGFNEPGRKWRTQSATTNPRAYEDYLQARLDLSGWADAPVQKALDGFQKAIDEDPAFANAYAGLASGYVLLADHGTAPFELSYNKAEEAAAKAIQLAPSTAEAHAILGEVALRRDWNFELAERELRRAVELEPSRPSLHLWLAVLLCYESRFDEALHEIDLARAADPLWAPVYGTEAFLASAAGQSPRAIQATQKLIALMPNWPASFDQRGWAYWYAGRYTDAIADWRHMAEMENDDVRLRLEDEGLEALRHGGVAAYARVRLKAIERGTSFRHASTDFVPAEWYTIAGDREKAIAELEQMLAHRDPLTVQLAANSSFAPLHNDPRFRAILTRAGLKQPTIAIGR